LMRHDDKDHDLFAKIGYNSSYNGNIYKVMSVCLFEEFSKIKETNFNNNVLSRMTSYANNIFKEKYHEESVLDVNIMFNTLTHTVGRIKAFRFQLSEHNNAREDGVEKVSFN
jgi:hypothetical protein